MPWALLPLRWTNDAAIGSVGDVYHHYVSGDQSTTILVTRWETPHDATQFSEALLFKGKRTVQFGANIAVLAGDVGEQIDALAAATFKDLSFWPDR
jgi:hypothetical protein